MSIIGFSNFSNIMFSNFNLCQLMFGLVENFEIELLEGINSFIQSLIQWHKHCYLPSKCKIAKHSDRTQSALFKTTGTFDVAF